MPSKPLAPLVVAALACLTSAPARAQNPWSSPTAPTAGVNATQNSPAEQAALFCDDGDKQRDEALALEEKAAAAEDGAKRARYLKKARKKLDHAIDFYHAATRIDPASHRAWAGLGDVLFRTERFDESLAAFNRALTIDTHDAASIARRGEAYLALGRIEEAEQSYSRLFALDPPRAGGLLQAMRDWLDRRRAEPGGAGAARLDELARWIEEQAGVAAQADGPANRR